MRLFAAILAVAISGCGARPDAVPAASSDSTAAGPAGLTPLPDSVWRPVSITLRRDSLRLAADASVDSVQAAMQRALVRLRSAADFEVLAVSPAVLAVQLRARAPGQAAALANALRGHPLVQAAEVEGVARP